MIYMIRREFSRTASAMKELETQVKVSIGLEALWQALTRDLRLTTPKVLPHIVKDVQFIDGGVGVGSFIQFNYTPNLERVSYQKEVVTEFDENLHQIGLEVIEGGQLDLGFSSYTTIFQLSAIGEEETEVHIKILYEWENGSSDVPTKNIETTTSYIKAVATYLSTGSD